MQNLINYLFQPNINLIQILNFPLYLLEAFIIISLSIILFNITYKKRDILIYIVLYSTLKTFSEFIIPMPYGTILNIIIMIFLIKYIFKVNVFKSILYSITPFIFIGILEAFFLIIASSFIDTSIDLLISIPIFVIGLRLFIYLLMYVLLFFLKKFNISILDNFNFNDKSKLILSGLLGLIAVYFNLYIVLSYSSYLSNGIKVITILVLIIYVFVTTYCLMKAIKLEVAKRDIKTLKMYNKTLISINDDIRAFKHDFNNIIQSIGGYIETEDLYSLKKYYRDLVKDCYSISNLENLKPEIINNPSIYNVLACKYNKAASKNIQMNIEVCMDLNTLNISTYEFTRIFGIFLDNSIEAAQECDEKLINVKFYNQTNRNRQVIIIENTYSDKNIDTIKIFEKSYSTKENNTGLGLWEVNKILNKHNNLSLFTTKNNTFFIQQLEIYKK